MNNCSIELSSKFFSSYRSLLFLQHCVRLCLRTVQFKIPGCFSLYRHQNELKRDYYEFTKAISCHQELKEHNIELIPVTQNLVDLVWPSRPQPQPRKLIVLDISYSGMA